MISWKCSKRFFGKELGLFMYNLAWFQSSCLIISCKFYAFKSSMTQISLFGNFKSTPGTCNRIRNFCGHHTYWFQSSHLTISCKFYAFESSVIQISLFGKFKSTTGTYNRIRNYYGHHTYKFQSSCLIISCKLCFWKLYNINYLIWKFQINPRDLQWDPK